jgi:hypothetical protein
MKPVGLVSQVGLDLFAKVRIRALARHDSHLRSQHAADRRDELLPLAGLVDQLFAAGLSQPVEPRVAIVGRRAPLGLDPLLRLQPLQSGIERSVIDEQDVGGLFLNAYSGRMSTRATPLTGAPRLTAQ